MKLLSLTPPLITATLLLCLPSAAVTDELDFRGQELPTRLQVGYAVQLLDMNSDNRLDIVIVDSKRILWLENPNWREHIMIEDPEKKHDNVCFAPFDIDGDGRLDFAVGADWQFNNTRSGGTIGWISPGETPTDRWTYHAIGEEPTVHRMQFVDVDGDERKELIVAPLKGRNTTGPDYAESGVRLLAFEIPDDPVNDAWEPQVISDRLHVVHNFTSFSESPELLLVASFEGLHVIGQEDGRWRHMRVATGDQSSGPSRGASEVKVGRLRDGAEPYYGATIEPWHGNKVVVYRQPDRLPDEDANQWLWRREVIDDQLKWGHAVSCADLDGDREEELVIGVRDDVDKQHRRGLRIYDPQLSREGDKLKVEWKRHIFDPGSVAIEDLAVGDLNGDGRADIVAVGRQTHNVKIYWNESKAGGTP